MNIYLTTHSASSTAVTLVLPRDTQADKKHPQHNRTENGADACNWHKSKSRKLFWVAVVEEMHDVHVCCIWTVSARAAVLRPASGRGSSSCPWWLNPSVGGMKWLSVSWRGLVLHSLASQGRTRTRLWVTCGANLPFCYSEGMLPYRQIGCLTSLPLRLMADIEILRGFLGLRPS